MTCDWNRVTLGRTGLSVSALGLSVGGGGLPAHEIERAVERGINYLYFGSLRGCSMAQAVRTMAPRRDKLVLVVQSYTRVAGLLRTSLKRGLRALGTDHADVLLLGWWSTPPPRAILDAALEAQARGLAKHIMVSCHDRLMFAKYIPDTSYGAIMLRYNASHPGAEREVFPLLQTEPEKRPGVVAYTATRWGDLVNPALTPEGERTPRGSDCYRFALTTPDVNVCLTAPANASQLDEAFAALDRGPMDADELAWMKRVGASIRARRSQMSLPNPVHFVDRLIDRWTGGRSVEK